MLRTGLLVKGAPAVAAALALLLAGCGGGGEAAPTTAVASTSSPSPQQTTPTPSPSPTPPEPTEEPTEEQPTEEPTEEQPTEEPTEEQPTEEPTEAPDVIADCALASDAIAAWPLLVQGLGPAVADEDYPGVVDAADALMANADDLRSALPGLPPEGAAFIDLTEGAASVLRAAAAEGTFDVDGLGDVRAALEEALSDGAYVEGAAAVEAYVVEACG